MKILIRILSFIVVSLLNVLPGYATGFKAGYLVFYIVFFFVAERLCKKWDEHKKA